MLSCNVVAMTYDIFQLFSTGYRGYFLDRWNYIDLTHVWCGYANLYFQYQTHFEKNDILTNQNLKDPKVKIFILISTLMIMVKSFFFLRIIPQLTQFVIMISRVTKDLKDFVFFYCLFILMFGIILSVLGIRNKVLTFGDGFEEHSSENIEELDRDHEIINHL